MTSVFYAELVPTFHAGLWDAICQHLHRSMVTVDR